MLCLPAIGSPCHVFVSREFGPLKTKRPACFWAPDGKAQLNIHKKTSWDLPLRDTSGACKYRGSYPRCTRYLVSLNSILSLVLRFSTSPSCLGTAKPHVKHKFGINANLEMDTLHRKGHYGIWMPNEGIIRHLINAMHHESTISERFGTN